MKLDIRIIKNKLTHLLRIAERQYYQGILEENRHNLRKSWRILKDIINKNTYRKKCTEFNDNGRTIKKPKSISNRFNEYFTNIGTSLANKIPNTKVLPNSFLGQSIAESIFIFPTTVDEIHKCILLFFMPVITIFYCCLILLCIIIISVEGK